MSILQKYYFVAYKKYNIIFQSLELFDILGKILQVRCYVYKTRPEIDWSSIYLIMHLQSNVQFEGYLA